MTLSDKQHIFTRMVARLLAWAIDQPGIEISLGEVFRTPEQQAIYIKQGKTRTPYSKHLYKLAIDLYLFKDGIYTANIADYEPLGHFWESIGGVWGGHWSKLRDGVHFQYEP